MHFTPLLKFVPYSHISQGLKNIDGEIKMAY
jgi:hypothetical protein